MQQWDYFVSHNSVLGPVMPSLQSSKSLHAHKCMSGWLFKVSTTVGPCILDQIDCVWGQQRPNQWFYQERVVTWLREDALGFNISKNQLRSKTQVKKCGLQDSFLKPGLKDPFCPVKQAKSHISVISLLVQMRLIVSKYVRVALNVYQTSSRLRMIRGSVNWG